MINKVFIINNVLALEFKLSKILILTLKALITVAIMKIIKYMLKADIKRYIGIRKRLSNEIFKKFVKQLTINNYRIENRCRNHYNSFR